MKNFKLYGNENFKSAVASMLNTQKIPHSIVITGEKGLGKKQMAKYFAMAVLCKNPVANSPCMNCPDCLMVSHHGHPDFIEVKPSGKNGIYRLDDDLRPLVSQAYIKPSQSKYKVILISDMDSTQPSNQNVLLKLVEEPPLYCIIIMTACSREYFLPTILSRVTHFKACELEKTDLKEAVKNSCENFDEEKFRQGFLALGGNCGRVLEFMDKKDLALAVEITKEVCMSICQKDEYGLLKAFSKADGDKQVFLNVLEFLSKAMRDCVIVRNGGTEIPKLGVCNEETDDLALRLGVKKAMDIYGICDEYVAKINGNGNLGLSLASICAEIMEILQ